MSWLCMDSAMVVRLWGLLCGRLLGCPLEHGVSLFLYLLRKATGHGRELGGFILPADTTLDGRRGREDVDFRLDDATREAVLGV